MAGKCEHGLTTRECMVCASPKYGAETGDKWVTIPRARLDDLEQMQATLDGLREMAEDSADRGDVFAQRVLRALGPNVAINLPP